MRKLLQVVLLFWATSGTAQDSLRMAVTTSFHNSGLSDLLLPQIKEDLGLEVQLLVVGTGQALRLGQAGDVDAILVHSRAAEEAFVTAGYGTHRREIMYNDFIVVGPASDPAGVSGAADVTESLQRIADQQAPFVSRGDESGTHSREISLWHGTGLEPESFGSWYRAVGAGMGAALNSASAMEAYILSDRASWVNFGNKGNLALLFAGDPALFNQYSYIPVNPDRHPHVKADLARELEQWLTSARAAALIDAYEVEGETLFVSNASTE